VMRDTWCVMRDCLRSCIIFQALRPVWRHQFLKCLFSKKNYERSRENCALFAFDSNRKISYIWLSNY
jgi:hypothetical protein